MKRGRKPLSASERTVTVSIRLPESWYDRAYQQATDTRITVPEFFRAAVERKLVTKNSQG